MSHTREYDQLHFFLDESGGFQQRDINLVGGVIMLGPYDDYADDTLLQILRESVQQTGGTFPRDLHFFPRQNDIQGGNQFWLHQRRTLCQQIANRLVQWHGDQREIFGIAICHQSDVFPHGSNLIVEREYDNRYLQMLYALIEFICFVYPEIRARLRPSAEVRIYVGQRHFPVPDTPENQQVLSQLGYKYFPDRFQPGQLRVRAITRRELRGLLRAGICKSWPNTELRFQEIGVLPISYDPRNPVTRPAALYLADLELGCLRGQLQGIHNPIQLLPPLAVMEYGPLLHQLARMQAALEEGCLASFFERAREFFMVVRPQSSGQPERNDAVAATLAAQQHQAAKLVAQNPHPVLDFLRSVCQLVDKPGYAQVGADLADFTVGILNQAGQTTPEAQVLVLQARLSAANHLGERHAADLVWEEYIQREEHLRDLGLRGLELMAEIRNRRAISLLDQFRFDEAKITVVYILSKVEQGLEALANMFNAALEQLPIRLIGTLYGTLGQIYALQSEPDHRRAEECFRKALEFFTEAEDRQRQWVYLGHLACDQGEQGRSLWQEVCSQLPELISRSPIAEEGKQYLLALQIKGLYIFAPLEDVLSFLSEWQRSDPTSAYSPESLRLHPFGLIYQGMGMLHQRVWRETRDVTHGQAAIRWFDRAAQHMRQGGPVLKVLSRMALIRLSLLRMELPSTEESQGRRLFDALEANRVLQGLLRERAEQNLGELFQGLRGYLAEHFGESAWDEGPDGRPRGHFGRLDPGPGHSWQQRAEAILRAIRFNYW